MTLNTLFTLLYRFNGLKCKFSSIEELKKIIKFIHNNYMQELIDHTAWIDTGEFEFVTSSSEINYIVEIIKLFSGFHPKLDEFLEELAYFKPHSNEIASRVLLSSKTYDTHNCLLQEDNNIWVWKSFDDENEPEAIRKNIKAKYQHSVLQHQFAMVENSYYNLNHNMANALKAILRHDGNRDGDGYDPSMIKNKMAHGFPLVGDVHYTDILSNMQKEIRVKLTEKYTQGVLRLTDHINYPNSLKNNDMDFSESPNVNIFIENEEITIDFNGNKILNSYPVEINNRVLIP